MHQNVCNNYKTICPKFLKGKGPKMLQLGVIKLVGYSFAFRRVFLQLVLWLHSFDIFSNLLLFLLLWLSLLISPISRDISISLSNTHMATKRILAIVSIPLLFLLLLLSYLPLFSSSLSSATNVAYIFWPTLYQDGRRLGTWPKAMHKPIKCYLSYQLSFRG